MLLVPVLFLSYGYSGNTHRFSVGDELSAVLVYRPGDLFVPPHLLVRMKPELGPVQDGGRIIRQGGLTAWSLHEDLTSGIFQHGAWFAHDLDADAPESLPPTTGTVRALEHVSVLVLPTGLRAPLVGLHPVANTEEDPDGLTVYAADLSEPVTEGAWSHFGWIATIAVADRTA